MARTVTLKTWVFMPTQEDRNKEWKSPDNYIRAAVGEIRLKPVTDTPMSDETIYEPGWYWIVDNTHDAELES